MYLKVKLCYAITQFYHLPLTPTAINGVPSDTSRQLDQWVRGAVLITCKIQSIAKHWLGILETGSYAFTLTYMYKYSIQTLISHFTRNYVPFFVTNCKTGYISAFHNQHTLIHHLLLLRIWPKMEAASHKIST